MVFFIDEARSRPPHWRMSIRKWFFLLKASLIQDRRFPFLASVIGDKSRRWCERRKVANRSKQLTAAGHWATSHHPEQQQRWLSGGIPPHLLSKSNWCTKNILCHNVPQTIRQSWRISKLKCYFFFNFHQQMIIDLSAIETYNNIASAQCLVNII